MRRTKQKDSLLQVPYNERVRGATRGRCESGARAAAPGSAMNKAGKTPLVPRAGQKCGNGREVPTDLEAPRQEKAATRESEVADVRRATAERRLNS